MIKTLGNESTPSLYRLQTAPDGLCVLVPYLSFHHDPHSIILSNISSVTFKQTVWGGGLLDMFIRALEDKRFW